MLKKPLQEGDKLEVGKTYCFMHGRGVANITSKGHSSVFFDDVILRITNIKTAKSWSRMRRTMTTQYTVTLVVVESRTAYTVGNKYVDIIEEFQIPGTYALTIDSKKVLSDLMEG